MAPTLEFTPEVVKQDARQRIANTTGQVGVPGAVVTIGEWVAHLLGWRGEIPTTVTAAMILLLTAGAAWLTNRRGLRGET